MNISSFQGIGKGSGCIGEGVISKGMTHASSIPFIVYLNV